MHWLSRISAPPAPALHLSMDHVSGSILPSDIGNIQGTLENAPVLVSNGVLGKALHLDGDNQSVNLGNQRHRCLGKEHRLFDDYPESNFSYTIGHDCTIPFTFLSVFADKSQRTSQWKISKYSLCIFFVRWYLIIVTDVKNFFTTGHI